jgi:outer membrane protein OmpA-like peptidoglycan-associated protein
LNDYKESFVGGAAGYDWFSADNISVFGVYVKYVDGSGKQGGSKADSSAFSAGIYGGIERDVYDISGVVRIGYNSYDTKRYIDFIDRTASADFSGISLSADIESGYKVIVGDNVTFRPYGGLEINGLFHGGFTESGADALNLKVDSGSMLVGALKAGADIVYNAEERLNVYVGGEAKYVALGDTPEISGSFVGTGETFKSRGGERDSLLIGLRAGAEGRVSERLRLFGTVNMLTSSKYNDFGWKAGLRYAFCGGKQAKKQVYPAATVQQPAMPVKPQIVQQQPQPVMTIPQPQPVMTTPQQSSMIEIGSLYYGAGVSDLGPNARKYLTENAQKLKGTNSKVYITGYAENGEPNAQVLAKQRAQKAAEYLTMQGIGAERLAFKGVVGPAQAGNTGRRVEFLVK